MSDPEATHDRLGADILSAHERLTRTIEARLPAMTPRPTIVLPAPHGRTMTPDPPRLEPSA